MDLPVDPVHMSVEEILAVLRSGHRSAAASGPEAAAAYLQRTIRDTLDLPHAVLMVAYELLSEAQAESLDWDGCTASLAKAQEERMLAQADPPPANRPVASAAATLDAAPPAAVQDMPPAGPAKRQDGGEKFCCACGKNVTHRSRRKDPLTRTYLCSECYGGQPRERSQPRASRPILWITLLSLLGVIVFGMLILSIGGHS